MIARPWRERVETLDVGRLSYDEGVELQGRTAEEVLWWREARERGEGPTAAGRLLMLEHDPPVITVSKRQGADRHLLASEEHLRARGIQLRATDRGGDITYHGPGQLVVYPILDLNRLRLNLHSYMRLLEAAVIDAVASFGVSAHRDVCATGVWVGGEGPGAGLVGAGDACAADKTGAKLCAMGVRVRKWVSMHGLALNVTTDLDHFGLIVPCGLVGRPVTSLQRLLGPGCPGMAEVKAAVGAALTARLEAASDRPVEGSLEDAEGRAT
ncbi:MAG: lipoyl(octanoyl) transferase [Phycisphaerales bacterium]|nr:lipoyl(octanoyl) transferase [Phycisphaerales bacterium]